MDPTANLKEQREIIEGLDDLRGCDVPRVVSASIIQHAYRLAELISDLDNWPKNGGCLPEQWKR